MEKIVCPKCNSLSVKSGWQNNVQRYKCKVCNNKFQTKYKYKAYNLNTNNLIKTLLKEGCGIRSISRILQISKNTVLSRMLIIAKQIKKPNFTKLNCTFEVDELWTYITSKHNPVWISYILERNSRKILNFFVGRKTTKNLSPLIQQIILLKPKYIYTDKLNIYPKLIPEKIHKRFQYCTNRIERNNLTLRTHIKRLSRKTICFSKSLKYLNAHLTIYFWG